MSGTGCANHAICALYPSCSGGLHGSAYYRKNLQCRPWQLMLTRRLMLGVYLKKKKIFFSVSAPRLTVPTKQLSGPNLSLKRRTVKICKCVPGVMRDDYVQRRSENFISVCVLLAHIINEGHAHLAFIFICFKSLSNRLMPFPFSHSLKKNWSLLIQKHCLFRVQIIIIMSSRWLVFTISLYKDLLEISSHL